MSIIAAVVGFAQVLLMFVFGALWKSIENLTKRVDSHISNYDIHSKSK